MLPTAVRYCGTVPPLAALPEVSIVTAPVDGLADQSCVPWLESVAAK